MWISDVVLSNTLLTIFSPSENKISRFDIYPNPASTYIKINSSALKGNVKIQVINIAGVLVKEIIENSDGQINISDLPNGFYSVRIITHTNLLQTGSFIKL